MAKVAFKEIVELFVNRTMYDLKYEDETPNINFKFGKDGFILFEHVKNNPFVIGSISNITDKDIQYILKNNDDPNVPTIFVDDSISFFEYLTDISNALLELYGEYNEPRNPRGLSILLLRRIWLRMGIEDISSVISFLKKQLEFTKNRTLEIPNETEFTKFCGYNVSKKTIANRTWDESTRSMIFRIYDDTYSYELPHIMYDIDDSGVCYIYAIQNGKNVKKDKKIERKIYKLNKGIENPNVHPNKVLSIMLFIRLLKEKGIKRIRIPSIQVLSYRYHEILSKRAQEDIEREYEKLQMFPNDVYCKLSYSSAKDWHSKVCNKEDYISYLKTEELMNLIERILETKDIEKNNEVGLQGDYLELLIK